MNYLSKGQSLIEILVAILIFIMAISGFVFLILDSYTLGRLGAEITKANFLAEEGIEAVRSIRDNSWENLTAGFHGLAIFGNKWIFHRDQEDISNLLNKGIRKIIIEDIDSERKKITSQVVWEFAAGRPQEVQLITYLTNWQKFVICCQGICTPCSEFIDKKSCLAQEGCSWSAPEKLCTGTCTPCQDFLDQVSCQDQSGCIWECS